MADIIVDGMTRVAYVPTAVTPAAMTVSELNAGQLLHWFLTPTGLEGFEPATAEVDNTALASTFDTRLPGRGSFSGTGLVFKKQDGTDAVFNLLSVFGTAGFIVIRDNLPADTAWAATQKYESYPGRTGLYSMMGRGEANSLLRWRAPWPIGGPRVSGVVAA